MYQQHIQAVVGPAFFSPNFLLISWLIKESVLINNLL